MRLQAREKQTRKERATVSRMRACVLLDVGVIVDCVILRRLPLESEFGHSAGAGGGSSPRLKHVTSDLAATSILSAEASMVLSALPSQNPTPTTTPRMMNDEHGRSKPTSAEPSIRYAVRTSVHPHRDTIVDHRDVVPFGFHSPSLVFAVRGRQLNVGMSVMVLDDGSVLAERYPRNLQGSAETKLAFLLPTPPDALLSKLGEKQEKSRQARAESEGGPLAALASAIAAAKNRRNVRTCTMSEVQLLPMLSATSPTPPLCVGTQVKVRRRANPNRLYHATVLRAAYDCSYTVQYDCDKEVERAVLHNDVLVVSTAGAEDVTVRDKVTFAVTRSDSSIRYGEGVVVLALGNQQYDVYGRLLQPSGDDEALSDGERCTSETPTAPADRASPSQDKPRRYTLHRSNITHVAPKFVEALHSEHAATLLPIFRRLDEDEAGTVSWAATVRFFNQSEYAGQPLSPADWSRLHRDLLATRGSVPAVELHLGSLTAVDAAVLDTVLSYTEFEYVATRILKLKW